MSYHWLIGCEKWWDLFAPCLVWFKNMRMLLAKIKKGQFVLAKDSTDHFLHARSLNTNKELITDVYSVE
jgi:hypothetical protein